PRERIPRMSPDNQAKKRASQPARPFLCLLHGVRTTVAGCAARSARRPSKHPENAPHGFFFSGRSPGGRTNPPLCEWAFESALRTIISALKITKKNSTKQTLHSTSTDNKNHHESGDTAIRTPLLSTKYGFIFWIAEPPIELRRNCSKNFGKTSDNPIHCRRTT